MKLLASSLLIMAIAVGFQACTVQTKQPAADLVLNNGKIYTLNQQQPWAEAVAIRDGKIIYVGSNAQASAYIATTTEVENLAGAMLMPGLNDGHVHPTTGAVKSLFECTFPFSAKPDDIASKIAGCAESRPKEEWIRGGQWSSSFFVNHPMSSPREFLDKVSGDKAVVLVDDSYHNAWMNTRALKRLGLFDKTSNITGGEVVKDPATGLPNGVVIEAFGFIKDRLHWSREQYQEAAAYAVKTANSFGITGMKGTAMSGPEIQGYQDYAEQNRPSIHMAAALMTPYGHREKPLEIEPLKALQQQYQGSHVDAGFVKIFMDGVPTVARTAAMLEPYTADKPGDKDNYGALHLAADILQQDVIALDKAGFTVKIHTAGDRSVRVALDAIEAARKANGASGLRHELAHAGFIDGNDMPRFKQLNAVADLSPYLWSPSPIMDSVITAVGKPRGEQYWPINSLLASGAPVLAGSDWPAAVPSINPWPGIESMVSRKDPNGQYPGELWPEQAVSLAQALHIFTRDSAKALKKSDETGAIEVGKSADMILLNHNLFEIPVVEISNTRVQKTWFAGRPVYTAEPVVIGGR